jgi:hypothetical protein
MPRRSSGRQLSSWFRDEFAYVNKSNACLALPRGGGSACVIRRPTQDGGAPHVPEPCMSTITSIALSPFTLLFRMSYARPWIAIAISVVAAVVAHMLDHDSWTVLFVFFGSYMLMWLDETTHPRPAPEALPED